MKPLAALKLFIRSDEERHEIRAYVLSESTELAPAFGVTVEELNAKVNGIGDDATLCRRLLETIKAANTNGHQARTDEKKTRAQAAADKLGATVRWEGDRARLDVDLLFASLTRMTDEIVFWGSGPGHLAIHQRPLHRVRDLHRKDLTAYIDPKGLHFRWTTGGLSFCHQEIVAPDVTVNLRDPALAIVEPIEEAPAPVARRITKRATHGKDRPMTPESLIDALQAKCLALLGQVQAEATAQIETLAAENATLHAELAKAVDRTKVTEAATLASAQIQRLTATLAERDTTIADLQARIDLDPSERIEELEIQLKDTKEELAESEKACEETQKELEELQGKIPDPEILAGAVHDFLRYDHFVPANLDVPLRLAPHSYRDGLARIVGEELPS